MGGRSEEKVSDVIREYKTYGEQCELESGAYLKELFADGLAEPGE